ncbi:MAG: class I SAM-dependent methyltransferase [Bacteroidia bacterium]
MRSLALLLLNNIFINRILIIFKKDDFIKKFVNNWTKVKMNQDKSLQENVGFSHTKQVDDAIQKIHSYVQETEHKYLNENSRILDIGCGVGLYLQDFKSKQLYGTDLNAAFLEQCRTLLPHAKTFEGDYLKINFEKDFFDCICSISVIEYIAPSKIKLFFNKMYSELKKNGIIVIQYPHALSLKDALYSDLSYISYIPSKIETIIKGKFKILVHEHSFDKRKVQGIDKTNYTSNGNRSFCNGMILIAQKL